MLRKRFFSPSRASSSEVADFLTDGFVSRLESGSVRIYKSAILSIHRGFADGSSLAMMVPLDSSSPECLTSRPPSRPQIPHWDLILVLDFLSRQTFEPLRDATLKNLSLITVVFFYSLGIR